MNLSGSPMPLDKCGPCLTPVQLKKQREQDVKEIKATINALAKHGYHSAEMLNIIGVLVMKLINFHGPLK